MKASPKLLLALSLSMPPLAQAAITAEARFGAPSFSVIDLDESDGVAPIFTLVTPEGSSVQLEADDDFDPATYPGGQETDVVFTSDRTTPVDRQLQTRFTLAHGQANQTPGTGRAYASAERSDTQDGSRATARSNQSSYFSFSGYGQLVISVPYTLTLGGAAYCAPAPPRCDGADAYAALTVSDPDGDGDLAFDFVQESAYFAGWQGSVPAVPVSGVLTLSLSNSGNEVSVDGVFGVEGYVRARRRLRNSCRARSRNLCPDARGSGAGGLGRAAAPVMGISGRR